MHVYLRFTVTVIVFQIVRNVNSATITIYEDDDFKGEKNFFLLEYNGQCHNIAQSWENRVSSITTGGTCVDLFAERNCEGEKRIRLYPGNYSHHNLSRWDFDDLLKSARACTKHINETNQSVDGNTVTVFEEKGFKGEFFSLNVDSCKNLPEFWRNRASATTTFDKCYKYYTDLNCKGRYIMQSLETPSHDDFSKWSFDDMTNSIGVCENAIPNVTPSSSTAKYSSMATSSYPTVDTPYERSTVRNSPTETFPPESGLKRETVVIISVAVVVIILLLLVICGIVVMFNYFRKRTNYASMSQIPFQLLNQKYIQDFMQGNPTAYDNIEYERTDGIFRAQSMAYDADMYEISLDYLQIDRKCPLGSGEFGTVSKATLNSPKFPEPFDVAVKMIKPGADPDFVKALLSELKIMMYLSGKDRANQHPHIVNLVGACTQKIYQMEPYIILEFCSQGSLDNCLKKQRKTFTNLIDSKGNILPRKNSLYLNDKVVDTGRLVIWSRDIAAGMEFLSQRKVIHGDLATRNILLDESLSAKISDFGLSRQLYNYTQYVKKQQAPLPWRWMALEALQDMTFSSQSDVWAFGVTLWEIFSLAEIPYPGIVWGPTFIQTLNDGFRMSQPKYATSDIYSIILQCWEEFPDGRPTFTGLRGQLSNILEQFFPPEYLELEEEPPIDC